MLLTYLLKQLKHS